MVSRTVLLIALLTLLSCKQEAPENPPESASAEVTAQASAQASSGPKAWKVPAAMPAEADLIDYGKELVTRTSHYLGPDVADAAKRYAGNRLSCKNCHLDAGQQAGALGFVGISTRFPQYRARENRQSTLAERVNGCFDRSLNGRPLPADSREMKAILAYMDWLSQGYQAGDTVTGQGLPELALLERAADPVKGQGVFQRHCASCHQAQGQGLLANPGNKSDGYSFPPLWGPDSFNTGAGMHRLLTAARYIKANMPLGAPVLTGEEAYDVAAFINSQPRPQQAHLEADFPDRGRKPMDAPFAPWDDDFPAAQHKYGPYQPMLALRQGKTETP